MTLVPFAIGSWIGLTLVEIIAPPAPGFLWVWAVFWTIMSIIAEVNWRKK